MSAEAAPAPRDTFQARLRYGVSVRSGSQQDTGRPNLTYSGMTPNDLALNAWGWFLLGSKIGLTLSVQREAFALYEQQRRVTGGELYRFSAGPTGRAILGPVKLEAAVSYAFHQLPTFADTTGPAFRLGTRHGVLLAARGIVDVGPVSIEARGEVPIGLGGTDGKGAAASSSGYAVGGAIRLQLIRTGGLMWGLLADVSYGSDTLTTSAGLRTNQVLLRGGGALDVKWQAEQSAVELPRFGELQVRVVDADTGGVMPGAQVEIGEQKKVADAAGVASVGQLLPGAVTARATAPGYQADQAQGTISAGGVLSLEMKLKRALPKVGSLLVKVTFKETKAPMAKATVKVGDASVVTDDQGVANFPQLPPGPIGITVSAPGFTAAEEAASVVAGKSSEVAVGLVEVKQRVMATITGLVRSKVGGKPIAADLEIPQLQVKTRANSSGAFSLRIEGGTYTVNISARGYLSQTKSVTVKDGDQAIFNVDLHPK